MGAWLAKYGEKILAAALFKILSKIWSDFKFWGSSQWAKFILNREIKKLSAKNSKAAEEYKDAIVKAGDDQDAQKKAADDFFNRTR